MTLRESLVAWLHRITGKPELPADIPPPPDYERPEVPRSSPEELRRAKEAVRTLDAFVAAQEGRRRRDEPRR